MALGPWTHSKQASTSTSSISSSAASPLPALFSPRQRGSMDSTRTSPDLDALPSKFAAKPQPISELADCASSLISFFWLSQAPGAVPRRGSALPRFANFMQHVLNTTQVSSAIVTLALLFIDRLRRLVSIRGEPGSEFSISVTALMLANKVSDDHTYSAATWSSVSGIALPDLVAAERELLHGLKFDLHVRLDEFTAWQRLLDGLGRAQKETTAFKRKKPLRYSGNSSPPRASTRVPSPVGVRQPLVEFNGPQSAQLYSQHYWHPQMATTLPMPRKRSHPDSETEQPPAKRFVTPSRNPSQADFYAFQATPSAIAPPPLPSALTPQGQPISDMAYLARGRPSPQPYVPPQLSYYSLAAGQRNGIPHQFQPRPALPMRLEQHMQISRNTHRDRDAYSMSPIQFQRRTTVPFTPPPLFQGEPYMLPPVSPGAYYPSSSFANAGMIYQAPSAVQVALSNWQFPIPSAYASANSLQPFNARLQVPMSAHQLSPLSLQ